MSTLVDNVRQFLGARRDAYRRTFNGPLADIVLRDLATFCRARESTFNPDARLHALAEGRREVWLRITEHMNMTEKELWERYTGTQAD